MGKEIKKDKRYTLEGTKALIEGRLVDGKLVQTKRLPLIEVNQQELLCLRLSKKPGFVLKKDGRYYYTPISEDVKLLSTFNGFGIHQCSVNCDRLSPAADCDGGCAKVRDIDATQYLQYGASLGEAIKLSKRIEKYPFIQCGCETFNTKLNCFVVLECTRYTKAVHTKSTISIKDLNIEKKNLEELAQGCDGFRNRDSYY